MVGRCGRAVARRIRCGAGASALSFVQPADGATVTNPVHVVFGVDGMKIAPAGTMTEGTGHHHLLVDGKPLPKGEVIPANDKSLHFGKGQTETDLTLTAGRPHADAAIRRRRASFVRSGNEQDDHGAREVSLGSGPASSSERGFGRVSFGCFRQPRRTTPCPHGIGRRLVQARAGDGYNGHFHSSLFPAASMSLYTISDAQLAFGHVALARSRGFLARSGRTRRPDRPQRRGQVVAAEDRRRSDEARRRPRHAPAAN